MQRSNVRGFTLIEVMITVAIIGILASVALPAYTDYLRRGQLPQAFTYLSDYRIKLEQYYQDNRNYGSSGCGTGGTTTINFVPVVNPRFFEFECGLNSSGNGTAGSGYVLTAKGLAGTRASGYHYSIDQAGNKKTPQFANATSTKNCWAVKGSDC
jgi:type IV pilus assembly protein PilE